METDPDVIAIQAAADEAGVAMIRVLRRANINPSTWFRWTRGRMGPRNSTLRAIKAALAEEIKAVA